MKAYETRCPVQHSSSYWKTAGRHKIKGSEARRKMGGFRVHLRTDAQAR